MKHTTHTNSLGMEFIPIPAGSFTMGTDKDSEEVSTDETPQHPVTISQPFYLGKTAVTQAQWEAAMGSNPSKFKGRSNPVENVSWNDVQAFIQRLNAREGTDKYRLPTEAEWEYAARAGTTGAYSFGDDAVNLGRYAWFKDNASGQTHPVGKKQPNPWGLYDMHGNVDEWVQDWYNAKFYAHSPKSDPIEMVRSNFRVLRGGSWYDSDGLLRSAFRYYVTPDYRNEINGFRLAFSQG
jgi:formylglycine-generating enzyme required for sulfatase activity